MQVSVESTGNLERRMTVEVPSERIDEAVEQRLRSMAGRVRVAGFRPGKVPLRVVKQRYGKEVYQEVVGQVLEESYREAIAQQQLRPAGSPQIEAKAIEPGRTLAYVATFEVYPEFKVGALDGLEITRPQVQVTEADVDRMIENLRRQRTRFEPVERAAAEGDRVTVDFEGTLDGQPFEGGKGENVAIVLGQGRMLKDFEQALEGMKAGEEKQIDLTFPEGYHAESLAGKTARFTLTAREVAEPRLPEVDEDFALGFGVKEGGVEGLRREIRANMERELAQAIKARIKSQVMDGLYSNTTLDLPKALVTEEIGRMRAQLMAQLGQKDAKQFPDELFADEARRRVALGLIIAEIVRSEDLKLDRERVESALQELASTYEDAQQVIDYYRRNPQAMSQLEAMVLEEQVVDWVLERAKVTDESMSFDSLMNPATEEEGA